MYNWRLLCSGVTTRKCHIANQFFILRVALLAAFALALAACSSPLGPIPGGKLEGEPAQWPDNWAFTDSIENVLLETNPLDPYSVTIWGVSVGDGFYVAAVSQQSNWVKNIDANAAVVLGIENSLYKAYARRVAIEDLPHGILEAYVTKYDRDPDDAFFEEGGIIFELVPRS